MTTKHEQAGDVHEATSRGTPDADLPPRTEKHASRPFATWRRVAYV